MHCINKRHGNIKKKSHNYYYPLLYNLQSSILYIWMPLRVSKVMYITCNMGAHNLPDMSGKSLMPMLQLLHIDSKPTLVYASPFPQQKEQ